MTTLEWVLVISLGLSVVVILATLILVRRQQTRIRYIKAGWGMATAILRRNIEDMRTKYESDKKD